MLNNKNKISTKILSIEDLQWILKAIIKGWYFFIITPIICIVIGFFYNYRITPKFASKIEILLKSNDVYDYQDKLYSNVGFYNYYGDITNQIRVITSYDLIQKTVAKLKFSNSYYIVGRINTKEFYGGIPFKMNIELLNKDLYEQPISFKILDHNTYSISYDINNKRIKRTHYFDSTEISIDYTINTNKEHPINNFKTSRSNLNEVTKWLGDII